MEAIIITVGISSIRNFNKQYALELEDHSKIPPVPQLIEFLAQAPEKVRAELNTLINLGYEKTEAHYILVTSKTPLGRIAGLALLSYMQKQMGLDVEIRYISHLHDNPTEFVEMGLHRFTNTLMEIIKSYKGQARILATGGFKAETAYATLVGVLTGVPVYYIHEKFHSVVKLPGLPLEFSRSAYEKYQDVIRKIEEAESNRQANKLIDSMPVRWRSLFDKEATGKGYKLSAAGSAFVEAMRIE